MLKGNVSDTDGSEKVLACSNWSGGDSVLSKAHQACQK